MSCSGCERVVRAVLGKCPGTSFCHMTRYLSHPRAFPLVSPHFKGVENVEIALPSQVVKITGTASDEAISAALTRSGKAFSAL